MLRVIETVKSYIGAVVKLAFERAFPSAKTPLLEEMPVTAGDAVAATESRKDSPEYVGDGGYYFKGEILDQLDLYFFYIERMRRSDPDAYELYSRLGAQLHANTTNLVSSRRRDKIDTWELMPWWKGNRPAFGALAYSMASEIEEYESKSKHIWPRFMYFSKCELPPASLQRARPGLDVYLVTIYWDSKAKGMKKGAPQEFGVTVDANGSVAILNVMCNEIDGRPISIPTLRKINSHGKRTGRREIPNRHWGIPEDFKRWAKQHKISPRQHLKQIFIEAANAIAQNSLSTICVRASNGRATAVFSVDIKRTPYFFKDREDVIDESGKRKRIFHIVRAHARKLMDRTAYVRFHFRGLRKFSWNGYCIEITVPFRDSFSLTEFDVGTYDNDAAEMSGQPKLKTTGAKKIAELILQRQKEGFGAKNPMLH